MIFIFEKNDIFGERKVTHIPTGNTFTIKSEFPEKGKKRFYLFNDFINERAAEPQTSMKRRQFSGFLNAKGYCPIEQRHIANLLEPFLDKVAKAAIEGDKATPKYLWKHRPDQRTEKERGLNFPPSNINCRCTVKPVVGNDSAASDSRTLRDISDVELFFGCKTSEGIIENSQDETVGLMATHMFTMPSGKIYFGHFVGSGLGSEIWVDIGRKMTRIHSDSVLINELKEPVPFSELKPGPLSADGE